MHENQNKLLKIVHLNAQSVKYQHHFIKIKEMVEKSLKSYPCLETWFNSTVSNVSNEIECYKVFRLDRNGKPGGGVCAYIKNTLKACVIKDLSGISESGLHQLWVQVQNKSVRSILVCIVYRQEIGLDCLET